MASAKSSLAFEDLRASVKRMQAEGERLVSRIRTDARKLATESRQETVSALLSDARSLRGDVRARLERVLRDLEALRDRLVAQLEEGASRLAEPIANRLRVVRQDELGDLRRRIADLERRFEEIEKKAQAA